ncbi:hypothetical protein B0T22DRAFT_463015 [Podospora appendiculata]|uniref:Uncharacterized protein n=1 Tax=Podospora appendiculata TaxID=314037 RepID=A0AAE0XD20_9PEZI|nr:hypothetical protein B0T22DRAFT_463015 [Podospora appendiculata]
MRAMNLDGWDDLSDLPDEKCHKPEKDEPLPMRYLDPSPAYEDAVIPRRPDEPPRLTVVGATWGGINVIRDIEAMRSASAEIDLDMCTLHRVLVPDPAYGVVKTLTLLYHYDGDDTMHLLNATEHGSCIKICPGAHEHPAHANLIADVDNTWCRQGRSGPYGVEILAVLYGPQKIETPSVLKDLARFFEGSYGQIRMTNAFFKVDPWPGVRKSWTVYFRFVGSSRIQCVTGMEDGALEEPWTRH